MTITKQIIDHFDGQPPFAAEGWELLHPGPAWMVGAEVSSSQPESGPTEYCCERFAEHATPADDILWLWALEGWLLDRGWFVRAELVGDDREFYCCRHEGGYATTGNHKTKPAALLAAMRTVWPKGAAV